MENLIGENICNICDICEMTNKNTSKNILPSNLS